MNFSALEVSKEWQLQEILFCLAINPNNDQLWFGSSDSKIYQQSLSNEDSERISYGESGHSSYVTGMVIAGDTLISCGYDKKLIWWDTNSHEPIRNIAAHDKWIRRICVTPDGRLFSVGDDMQCRVWDLKSGDLIASFSDHAATTPHHFPSMLYALALSDDGSSLATGDRVGHVAIWDSHSFEKRAEIKTPDLYTWDPKQRRHSIGGIRCLSFSPDGTKMAVGGMGKVGNIDHLDGASRIEIFEIGTGERLQMIEDAKHKGLVEQLRWSPDGKFIVSAGGDHKGFIAFHETETGKQVHVVEHSGHIHGLHVNFQTDTMFTAAHQRLAKWSFGQPKEMAETTPTS